MGDDDDDDVDDDDDDDENDDDYDDNRVWFSKIGRGYRNSMAYRKVFPMQTQ